GLWFTGIILAVLTLALTIDALIQPIAPFDLSVMNAIQSIDIPGLLPVMHAFEKLTSSEGAIGMWFAVLVAFALARKWLPALAMLMMPVGGVINEGLGEGDQDRKSTRLNSSHVKKSYAVFCLKKRILPFLIQSHICK